MLFNKGSRSTKAFPQDLPRKHCFRKGNKNNADNAWKKN